MERDVHAVNKSIIHASGNFAVFSVERYSITLYQRHKLSTTTHVIQKSFELLLIECFLAQLLSHSVLGNEVSI